MTMPKRRAASQASPTVGGGIGRPVKSYTSAAYLASLHVARTVRNDAETVATYGVPNSPLAILSKIDAKLIGFISMVDA